MSIIGNPIMAGASGPAASIFVTGLSETDTVTATNGSKTLTGKWVTKTKTVPNSPLIPAMTSDTEPSGVASATKVRFGNSAYCAFDGNDSTFAYGDTNALPWTLQYEFPQPVSINSFSYLVSTSSSTDGGRTSTHNVEVSLDGSTWETIWSGTTTRGDKNPESGTVTIAETKTIKYIRWVNTAMTGSENPSEEVFSLQVYGDVEVQVSGFEISPIRDLGTWTVTATNGTYTATQDVLVDVITEYEIEMSYKLWLYKDGVSYGFENYHFYGTPSSYGSTWSTAGKVTTDKIDLSKYSKICWTSPIVGERTVLFFADSKDLDSLHDNHYIVTPQADGVSEYSIENINNSRYVAVGGVSGGRGDVTSVTDDNTYYYINDSSSGKKSYFGRIWLE